jgi:hypothetical protein
LLLGNINCLNVEIIEQHEAIKVSYFRENKLSILPREDLKR